MPLCEASDHQHKCAADGGSTTGDGDGDDNGDGDGDGGDSTDSAECGSELTETSEACDDSTSESGTDEEASSACGDGIVDPREECDGSDLAGLDCAELGFSSGELACATDCSLDTTGCVDAVCGDGEIAGDEECDGSNLGGIDCAALGLGDGEPSCTDVCELDTSACATLGEGEPCGLYNECPYPNLVCVGGQCYDGSEGDPCSWNSDCADGLTCKPWGSGTCQP